MLRQIEAAARTCYKSEPVGDQEVTERFVSGLIQRGHESTLEHQQISVRICCDRGVSHELVRHRICAFSQESTRFVDYLKGQCCFVIPSWVTGIEPGIISGAQYIGGADGDSAWVIAMLDAEERYRELRQRYNWRPEQARSVLPNSTKTELVMTANVREWRHILKLRTSKPAHPDMRAITVPLLSCLQAKVAVLFDDIKPES
jgi:thymidylate synthase (FAD)